MSHTDGVTLVDHFTNFDAELMTHDGLHPNVLGQKFMAQRWFDAIQSSSASSLSPPTTRGDLDGNNILDASDIELLQCLIHDQAVNDISNPQAELADFDLTEDGFLDATDVTELVEVEIGTRRGDVDLNGVVDFDDFLVVSKNYGQPGKWSSGDLDSDGVVGFLDFLHIARNYEG